MAEAATRTEHEAPPPAPSAPDGRGRHAAPPLPGGDDLGPAARRGTTRVADRVVEQVARAAALSVPGVAPAAVTGSGVGGAVAGALGRTLPRVALERAGHRVDAEVAVASLWPHPAARVAAGVREAVTTQLRDLAGITADVVSVAVVDVVRPPTTTADRRVS